MPWSRARACLALSLAVGFAVPVHADAPPTQASGEHYDLRERDAAVHEGLYYPSGRLLPAGAWVLQHAEPTHFQAAWGASDSVQLQLGGSPALNGLDGSYAHARVGLGGSIGRYHGAVFMQPGIAASSGADFDSPYVVADATGQVCFTEHCDLALSLGLNAWHERATALGTHALLRLGFGPGSCFALLVEPGIARELLRDAPVRARVSVALRYASPWGSADIGALRFASGMDIATGFQLTLRVR